MVFIEINHERRCSTSWNYEKFSIVTVDDMMMVKMVHQLIRQFVPYKLPKSSRPVLHQPYVCSQHDKSGWIVVMSRHPKWWFHYRVLFAARKIQVEIHYHETSPEYLHHFPKFIAKITGINQVALPFPDAPCGDFFPYNLGQFDGKCQVDIPVPWGIWDWRIPNRSAPFKRQHDR